MGAEEEGVRGAVDESTHNRVHYRYRGIIMDFLNAMRLFNQMRAQAHKRGFLSGKEIEAEIKAARAGMKNMPCRMNQIENFSMLPCFAKRI